MIFGSPAGGIAPYAAKSSIWLRRPHQADTRNKR
jgi:hypothetical protein